MGRHRLVATDTKSGVGRSRNRRSICGKGNNTLLQRIQTPMEPTNPPIQLLLADLSLG